MSGLYLKDDKIFLSYSFCKNNYNVPEKTVESWTTRDVGQRIRIGNHTYIEYGSIPIQTRSKYNFKSLEELRAIATLEQCEQEVKLLSEKLALLADEMRNAVISSFHRYTSLYNGKFSNERVDEYSKRHALYTYLIELKKSFDLKMIKAALDLYTDCPIKSKSYNRLRKNIIHAEKSLAQGGLDEFVTHGNVGNKHNEKLSEIHKAILVELYKNPKDENGNVIAQKLSIKTCWNDYRAIVLNDFAEQPASYSTVKRFLSTNFVKTITFKSRHGSKPYGDQIRPYSRRTNTNWSFTLCAGDGWNPGRSILFSHKDVSRATVWLWYDWHSEAIIGFEIGRNENSEMIRLAFRKIGLLHNDHFPKEVLIDKKWSENEETRLLFEKAGVLIKRKKAYNPKENKAERLIKELNKIHREFDKNWASLTNHTLNYTHNDELIRKAAPLEYPVFRSMIIDIISAYNNQKLEKYNGKSRIEVCQERICENPKVIHPLERVRIFGNRRIATVRNGAFKIQIASKQYEYEIPQWEKLFSKSQRHSSVAVYYDESFMQSVDVFHYKEENNPDQDTHLAQCHLLKRYNPSSTEQTKEDQKTMGHYQKVGNDFDKAVEAELAKYETIVDTFDLRSSIQRAGQDRYKEALSAEMSKKYRNVFEDEEKEKGYEIVESSVRSNERDQSKKYNKRGNLKRLE
jgi:hypothetical protein